MSKRSLLVALCLATAAVTVVPAVADAQRSGGRYELEYEGPAMGGVTGVGATYSLEGGALVIDLPAVVRSYPTVRFVRRGGIPERPSQLGIGTGPEAVSTRFTHPDLPEGYVGEAGVVRITEISNGTIRGEFAIVASPAGAPGTRSLTFRGRFEAVAR